jgi:amino acid transporter/nucleotide-binding universal stress UspA family protein
MSTSDGAVPSTGRRLVRAAQVIVVSSVMFTFISYWRTAAVVLCDLASTAYYIGGIVEQAIGPAAPWFILAVMLFSYAVRSVYLESCSMFVRGGVYKVVKEAMGGFLAKLSVSALMFDYVLTGPISGVSACQYLIGLVLEVLDTTTGMKISDYQTKTRVINWGSAALACLITLYFFRQNLLGIHESSDKALKIMIATTIMAVVILTWSCVTLAVQGRAHSSDGTPNRMPLRPDLHEHNDYLSATDPDNPPKTDPLGFISNTGLGSRLRELSGESRWNWLSLVGVIGLFIAFGHSILAMSGEETLAQVYREVESPKMKNFKKAAFIVFVYSLLLTAGISFLAVLLVPEDVRMKEYVGNLISGLAKYVYAPEWAQPWAPLLLNAFVVIVGFLILSGAVNTAIIGSNGVLNRVAEDGVLPDWFLKPHPRYGTTDRILYLILFLQLATIIYSQGDVIVLGEAYAFGVVWSFVFKAAAMVVLRFTEPGHREFKVPLNIRWRNYDVPIGLGLIFVVLLVAALMNLLTKERATIWGGCFTAGFLAVFIASERYHERRLRGTKHEHLDQFNKQQTEEITRESLRLVKPYRKLVAIRSPHNLYMLEKSLAETDPVTTDVVVLTAKVSPPGGETRASSVDLDSYDQHLMTAVVDRAERAGKPVVPLIVPTNNPLHAVLKTALDLQAQELVMGASNKYTADEQLEQIGFYWISLHQGEPAPLTVRLLSRDRDVALDLAGGNRIPKISERQARSVAELRAAGVGVDRVLLLHDGSPASSDLFQAVLTMLDPQVSLALLPVVPQGNEPYNGHGTIHQDEERARKLGRELSVASAGDSTGPELVRVAQEGEFDLIVLPLPPEPAAGQKSRLDDRAAYLLEHAHCRVFLAAAPPIPQETDR